MHWLNIEIIRTQGPEYTSAEPAQQLAWFHLLLYCAQQENGGIIREASTFTDRQWMRLIDVEGATLRTECLLWTWAQDGSLIVWEYPAKQEQVVQAKREGGRRGGDAKAQNRSTPSSTPSRTPTSTPSRTPSTKEELEEEEKEKEESFASAPADAGNTDSLFPIDPPQPKPKREPKPKQETTADPRLKPIKDGLAPVFEKTKGREFDCDWKKTVGAIRRFLESRSKVTPDEFLEVWSLVCKYSSSPFYPKITDALDVAYLCRNYETVTGHIERAYHSESQAKR